MGQGAYLIQGGQDPRRGQSQLWQELVKKAHEEIALITANINDHLGLGVPHNTCLSVSLSDLLPSKLCRATRNIQQGGEGHLTMVGSHPAR